MESSKRSIFDKIIANELPAEKLFEDEWVIAIRDIHPVAAVHILIIPKKAIPSLQQMQNEDYFLLGHIVKTAQQLAIRFALDKTGYRLLTNCGADAGQMIFHLHFHLVGGEPLGPIA